MSLSNSRLAYDDCEKFLEKALDAERGVRLPYRTSGEAEYFRMRCNQFRAIDRSDNKSVHEPGALMHGKSVYDELTLKVMYSPDGYHWVYAERRILNEALIEPIPVNENELLLEFEEIKRLEYKAEGNSE
jgi:hypothetical protein